MEIVFVNSGMEFKCFCEAMGAVFLTFSALKISLKTKGFLTKYRISSSGSAYADLLVFGLSKDIKE